MSFLRDSGAPPVTEFRWLHSVSLNTLFLVPFAMCSHRWTGTPFLSGRNQSNAAYDTHTMCRGPFESRHVTADLRRWVVDGLDKSEGQVSYTFHRKHTRKTTEAGTVCILHPIRERIWHMNDTHDEGMLHVP